MNEQLIRAILDKGTFFYPASKHYNNGTTVTCDYCYKTHLVACIGYESYDLCIKCLDFVTRLYAFTSPPAVSTQASVTNNPFLEQTIEVNVTSVPPRHNTLLTSSTHPAIQTITHLKFCAQCKKEGRQSTIIQGGQISTAVFFPITYNEFGVQNPTGRNVTCTDYSCSNGHRWTE